MKNRFPRIIDTFQSQEQLDPNATEDVIRQPGPWQDEMVVEPTSIPDKLPPGPWSEVYGTGEPESEPEQVPTEQPDQVPPTPSRPQLDSRFPGLNSLMPPPVIPSKATTSPVDELKEAQDKRTSELNELQKRRAFNQLFSGLAGVGDEARKSWQEDTGFMKGQADLANLKVEDVEQKRKSIRAETQHSLEKLNLEKAEIARDPNSELSKAYRQAVQRIDPSVDSKMLEKLSADQIEKVYGVIKDDLTFKDKAQEKALARELKDEGDRAKRSDKLSTWLEQQISPIKSIRGNLGSWRNSQLMANRIKEMLPPKGAAIDRLALKEAAGALASMIKGGVATDAQIKGILPDTVNMLVEDKVSWVTGNSLPSYNEASKFVEAVRTFADKMDTVYSKSQMQEIGKIFNQGNAMALAKTDPERLDDTLRVYGFKLAVNDKGRPMALPDPEAETQAYNDWIRRYAPDEKKNLWLTDNTVDAKQPSGMVKVRDPKGRIRLIPKEQLDSALKAGGQVAK
jgi:hypothetical protein